MMKLIDFYVRYNWGDNITVQELIDRLSDIEDKSQRVVIECIGNHKVYDANEIVGAYAPTISFATLISNV